jgi:hypothetical protein
MDDERLPEEMLRHWESMNGYLPVKAGPILTAEVRLLRVERDAARRERDTFRRLTAERTQEASVLRQEREGLQGRLAALEGALRTALEEWRQSGAACEVMDEIEWQEASAEESCRWRQLKAVLEDGA